MTFGEKVRRRRKAIDLTQEELAKKIDVDLCKTTVSHWENGIAYPNVAHLLKLAIVLEMPLNYLFEEELYSIDPVASKQVSYRLL